MRARTRALCALLLANAANPSAAGRGGSKPLFPALKFPPPNHAAIGGPDQARQRALAASPPPNAHTVA
ncbi:hypothetical protein ABTM50_19405, partial [Acinetobacter baumannii]